LLFDPKSSAKWVYIGEKFRRIPFAFLLKEIFGDRRTNNDIPEQSIKAAGGKAIWQLRLARLRFKPIA